MPNPINVVKLDLSGQQVGRPEKRRQKMIKDPSPWMLFVGLAFILGAFFLLVVGLGTAW